MRVPTSRATTVPKVAPVRSSLDGVPEPRQMLAAIIESSNDAIASKDLNGIITSWNRAAEELFGYNAEEMIGRSVTMLIPADRQEEETEILSRIRRGEKIDHYETVRQRKDGTLIDISLNVSPVRNARGRIVGASKVARDISSRKQTERMIRELSTPVLEVQERLLVVPLIGVLDATRSQQLTEQLLRSIRDYRARAVVLDLTGVADMGAAAASQLRQTIQAARLLGAATILSGISQRTAQILSDISIFSPGEVTAVSNLRAAVEAAHELITSCPPQVPPAVK